MKSTGSACSLLLLTMAAVSSGRSAKEYFEEAGFQYSPARPDDALVFFIGIAPPLICEPGETNECFVGDPPEGSFCLSLPGGYSAYTCSFEGTATVESNFNLVAQIVPDLFHFSGPQKLQFSENRRYCINDSQLPDEYFRLRVQRPHEDHPVKCLLGNDIGKLYVRFPGYPTILCQLGVEAGRHLFEGRYHFNLPGIVDDPLKCVFRVYSELPLVDTLTEQLLYQSLITSLPSPKDGVRPRIMCSRHVCSNSTTQFQLVLQRDVTYDCFFPDAPPRHQPPPETEDTDTTAEEFLLQLQRDFDKANQLKQSAHQQH